MEHPLLSHDGLLAAAAVSLSCCAVAFGLADARYAVQTRLAPPLVVAPAVPGDSPSLRSGEIAELRDAVAAAPAAPKARVPRTRRPLTRAQIAACLSAPDLD